MIKRRTGHQSRAQLTMVVKIYAENCRQSHQSTKCPLCRQDWGTNAVGELSRENNVAQSAPNVHRKRRCRACKANPIYGKRYRCVQCADVDLCRRCFDAKRHAKHVFVVKSVRNGSWEPAPREDAQVRNRLIITSTLSGSVAAKSPSLTACLL